MIIPIADEESWRKVLDGLPSWQPPMGPTLIVSPHPDDETLAVGGLISRLTQADVDVSLVAVTDGENAYEGEHGLGPVRELEQTAALALLGVSSNRIWRLRLRDSGLQHVEDLVVSAIRPLVKPGGHIVAPWIGDFHPDHEVCGRAARVVAEATGASLTYYFFWTWHRGTPSTLNGLKLATLTLSEGELKRKQDALMCHQTQLHHSDGSPILPANLLLPMERPYEVYLPA